METLVQVLKLGAGVGLFLFAMVLIEDSISKSAGRNFKLFLQKITKNTLGAVAGGAVVTGILQSSSMVSIMVLAFVSAGVFTMKNALALILGANLGTTLDSWLVATLGFKTNIEVVAYPAVLVGGLLLILFSIRKSIKYVSYFLLGFGLLFIGLSFMKSAMMAQLETFDFAVYASKPLLIYLLIGFLITLLVQSSSVTMALTLTAIHVNAIDFSHATVIVLGSETGTTIKLLLSGIGGNAIKKRVLLGNLLFNVCLTILAFVFLQPIIQFITLVMNIQDPLIALVTFSTLVNLVSVMLFLPILGPFTRFLDKFFRHSQISNAAFISQANSSEPQTALDLFNRETRYFIHNCMLLNMQSLNIEAGFIQRDSVFTTINETKRFNEKTVEDKYEFLKMLQGEIQSFYVLLRQKLLHEQLNELNQLVAGVRHAMYSAKSIKDVSANIFNLGQSSKHVKYNMLVQRKTQTEKLYQLLFTMCNNSEKPANKSIQDVFKMIDRNYNLALHDFYKDPQTVFLLEIDFTTVINFNRELLSSNQAMATAVQSILTDEKQNLILHQDHYLSL